MCWTYILAVLALVVLYRRYRQSLRIERITQRHVFITGCDTGFGRSLAKSLDKLGVHVYAGCLQEKSVKSLHEQCSSNLKAIKMDITKSDDVKNAAKFVEKALNGKALWALVNNAGITPGLVPFEWSVKEDFQRTFAVNLFGMVEVTQTFLPLIKRGKEGRIVNVTSVGGRVTVVCNPYIMSKFAAEGFTDGLAFEMKPFNITIHAIEPSAFKTGLCDFEMQKREVNRRWEQLDPDMQKSYGKQYLDAKIFNVERAFTKSASDKIHEASDAMTHALLAKHPQERYLVGKEAKFYFFPISYMPVWIQIWVFNKLQKLAGSKELRPAESATNL